MRHIAAGTALALSALAFWGCYRETGVEEFPVQGTQVTVDNSTRIAQGRDAMGRVGDFVLQNTNLQIVANGNLGGNSRSIYLPRVGGAVFDISTQFRTSGNQDVRPRDDDGLNLLTQGVNLNRHTQISYSEAQIQRGGEFEGTLLLTGSVYDFDGSLAAAGAAVDAATRRVLDCAVETTIFIDDLTGVQNQERDPPQYATFTTVIENRGQQPLPIFTVNDIVVTSVDTMTPFVPYPDWGLDVPEQRPRHAYPHFVYLAPSQLNTAYYGFFSFLDGLLMVDREQVPELSADYAYIGKAAPRTGSLDPGEQMTFVRQVLGFNSGTDVSSTASVLEAYDLIVGVIRDNFDATPIPGHLFNEIGLLSFDPNVRNAPGGELVIEMINQSVTYFDGSQYRQLEEGRAYPVFGGRPILVNYDVALPEGQVSIRGQAINSEPFSITEGVNLQVDVPDGEDPVTTPLTIDQEQAFDLGSNILTGALHANFRVALTDDDGRILMGRASVHRTSAEGPVETGQFPGPRQGSYVHLDLPNIISALPNGEYELFVSHGPLYDIAVLDMTIDDDPESDGSGDIDLARDFTPTLERIVPLPNFLSADFDARTFGDPLNLVAEFQMLRFAYAEDIDVAFFGNTYTQSLIDAPYRTLATLLGGFDDNDRDADRDSFFDEVATTRALAVIGKAPAEFADRGRFTLLNLPTETQREVLEAPLFESDPATFYDRARALGENVVVHVTRPRAPKGLETGLFTAIAELGGLPAGAPIPGDHPLYSQTSATGSGTRWVDFDAVQLLAGNRYDEYLLARQDWFNLLNAGVFKPATGGSSRGQTKDLPMGAVRTWVSTQNTQLRDNDLAEFWTSVKAGAMFVSNGPTLVADIGGASYGGTATATGDSVQVNLRLLAAPWIPVRQVRAVVDGQVQVLDLQLRDTAVVRFDGTVEVALPPSGAHWIVFEAGATLDELAAGQGEAGQFGKVNIGHLPVVFTNPIFVNN